MTAPLVVGSVWRYPVKGLGGERLSAAEIAPRRGIAGDRRWLMATADVSALLGGREKWRPWNYGPSLKKDPRMSMLRAFLRGGELTIESRGGESARGDPETEGGRRRLENFLRDFFADGAIVLADCDARPAWDYADAPLTVLFSADVDDLSRRAGAPAGVERFRANIVLDGGAATDGARRDKGALLFDVVELTATEGVERCAAARVNPRTGARDMNVAKMLLRHYRRNAMGVKCAVRRGGKIAEGESAAWN